MYVSLFYSCVPKSAVMNSACLEVHITFIPPTDTSSCHIISRVTAPNTLSTSHQGCKAYWGHLSPTSLQVMFFLTAIYPPPLSLTIILLASVLLLPNSPFLGSFLREQPGFSPQNSPLMNYRGVVSISASIFIWV